MTLDDHLIALGDNLRAAGNPDDADLLDTHAAYLRETPRNPGLNLFDALETIRDAAAEAAQIVARNSPPPPYR